MESQRRHAYPESNAGLVYPVGHPQFVRGKPDGNRFGKIGEDETEREAKEHHSEQHRQEARSGRAQEQGQADQHSPPTDAVPGTEVVTQSAGGNGGYQHPERDPCPQDSPLSNLQGRGRPASPGQP